MEMQILIVWIEDVETENTHSKLLTLSETGMREIRSINF